MPIHTRISPEQTERIIALYRQGITTTSLATRFSISKRRVLELLAKAGLEVKMGRLPYEKL